MSKIIERIDELFENSEIDNYGFCSFCYKHCNTDKDLKSIGAKSICDKCLNDLRKLVFEVEG
jgi:hypothetical protein